MGFMLFHIAWACGFLPGVSGFAYANELDEKIDGKLQPIYGQLGAITTQLAESREAQKEAQKVQARILQSQLSAQLRDLHRLKCSTQDDHVRMRMERDIEEVQQEYRELSGERYPLPACKDL
jgi:hypothetical protein